MSTDELLTTKQAAGELGFHETRLRALCRDGRIGRKYGGTWLISRGELERVRGELAQDPRSPLHQGRQAPAKQ